MSKQLELLFENEAGRQVTISLDNPLEPVDSAAIFDAMTGIVEGNALSSSGGDVIAIRGARLVERHVEDIDLPL